jgi:site-specific DNA-methyltransferase (adenine-specific)
MVGFAKKLKERPDLREKVERLPFNAAMKVFEQHIEAEEAERLVREGIASAEASLILGDGVDEMGNLPPSSIDLVLTDPPYGIPNLQQEPGRGQDPQPYKQALSDDDNMTPDGVRVLLTDAFVVMEKVLKPSAHFYVFFAPEWYQVLVDAARHSGMECDPVPIIWDKERASAPFYGYKYATSYEAILYGWKKPRERRLTDSCRNVLTFKAIHSSKKRHPFEKPLPLLRYLIRQSTRKGEKVLDPFGGSGSTGVAALKEGRGVVVIEKNDTHFYRMKKRVEGWREEVLMGDEDKASAPTPTPTPDDE